MVYKIKIKEKREIKSPKIAFKVFRDLLKMEDEIDREKEHFWVMSLTARNNVKCVELVSLGSIDTTVVHPREVFRRAISIGAVSLIVAHNHPSGSVEPSEADLAIVKRLKEAGKIIGIEVKDALIITKDDYFSFRSKGLI